MASADTGVFNCGLCVYKLIETVLFLDEATIEEMFGKKEIKPKKSSKSTLTTLLKLSKEAHYRNPFEQYKQFNGEVCFTTWLL